MANIKISEMTEANSAGNNDYIPIVQNGTNKKITIQKLLENAGGGGTTGDTLPIGATLEWPSNTIPTNWLECNGQAVSRTDYSELFAVLGTTYGGGDGTTTFNLPDYRRRVGVGKDSSDNDFNVLGKTGGEKTHKLTVNEMPSHTHDIKNNLNNGIVGLSYSAGGDQSDWAFQDIPDGSGSTGSGEFYATSTGGNQSHNNTQPYITTIYIIKAKQGEVPTNNSYDMRKNNGNSTSNTYTLLARYELTGDNVDFSDTIIMSKANLTGESSIISVSLRKNTGQTLDVVGLKYLTPKINKLNFYIFTTYNSSTNTVIALLYVHNTGNYTVLYGKSLIFQKSSNNITRQYFINEPNLTTLPAGNQHTITNYTLSSLELIGNYFDTPDYNEVVKSDNICVVKFRGRVKNNIPNATHIFNAPFNVAGRVYSVSARYGGRYEPNNQMFLWFAEFKKLNSQAISVGQYIHLDFTYICED